jgi:hypothetical protein
VFAERGTKVAWVQMISAEAATGKLRALYQRVRERAGIVPNIVKLQSLRPDTTSRGWQAMKIALAR